MANENEAPKVETGWSPEQKIQGFKELVTAILGVLILACTLFLAVKTFGYVGDTDPKKITDAKDILQVLLGVAGVVVGYYFGRVPADARAAQAQEQANAATAQMEQSAAQAQTIADESEQLRIKISPSATARGAEALLQGDSAIVMDLQRLRDKLRALANMSRTHK